MASTRIVVPRRRAARERTLVECAPGFAVAGGGYYAGCADVLDAPLHRLDPASGRDELLGRLEGYARYVAASPDGRTLLYLRVVDEGSDLMLIENFR